MRNIKKETVLILLTFSIVGIISLNGAMAQDLGHLSQVTWSQVTCLLLGAHFARSQKSQSSSVLFFNQDTLDPQQRKELVRQYITEMFSPVTVPNPTVKTVLLLDNSSFIRDLPVIYERLRLSAQDYDIKKDIKEAKEDYFKNIYKQEAAMDKEDIWKLQNPFSSRGSNVSVDINRLKLVNMNVFTVPRHFETDDSFRNGAGDYISRSFGSLGLVTGFQQFSPTQFLGLFYDTQNHKLPSGSNIFGIYPGSRWGTPEDRVLIIGAHWDTQPSTDGFNDNGSGITAVLEVARVLRLHECKTVNSIIFVAFDLEEVGNQGSLEFLHRFLLPEVLRQFGQKEISGAFIVDTVLNYNDTDNSQEVPDELRKTLPETADAIKANGFRGNFLNILQRSFDNDLAERFEKHWNGKKSKYGLIRSNLNLREEIPPLEDLEENINYLRSDHSRFWFVNQTDFPSLKAVLLTDTGPARGQMKTCYHAQCDSVRNGHKADFADFDFFSKTVQTLLDTAMEMTEAKCSRKTMDVFAEIDSGSGSSMVASQVLSVACVLMLVWW